MVANNLAVVLREAGRQGGENEHYLREAQALLEAMIAREPRYAPLWSTYIAHLGEAGADIETLVTATRRAHELIPEDFQLRLGMGATLLIEAQESDESTDVQARLLDQACREIRALAELHPDHETVRKLVTYCAE